MALIKPINFDRKSSKNKKKLNISGFELLSLPYIVTILFLVLLPVLMIGLYAFIKKGASTNVIFFSFDNFIRFFSTPENLTALGKSMQISIITTIICLLLGYPMAYIIAKAKGEKRNLLILLITAPMWINMLLRVYAWRQILEINGPLNAILVFLGFGPVDFLATDIAAIIGMVYVYLPFMIIPIYTILLKLDTNLIEASQDLGANKTQTFWRVIFPLSLPGILSGMTMVLLPTATTLVVPEYLSYNNSILIGNLIEIYFKGNSDWGYGSAISIVLAIIIMAMVLLARKLDKFSDIDERKVVKNGKAK